MTEQEPAAQDPQDAAAAAPGEASPSPPRKANLPAARRRGRALALQALYEADASGHNPATTVERLIENETLQAETQRFARWLVAGVARARPAIDDDIRRAATQWPVEQLAVVDRNILRIAIYEMLVENETPVRIAVNEAVELAKAFGAESSPRFVNGVLGALSTGRRE